MTYQTCPKCNGEGVVWQPVSTAPDTCPVCEGKMIISELTGKPPKQEEQK